MSLSQNGYVAAIGSPYNDAMAENSGAVWVYEWDYYSWKQVGGAISGFGTNSFFGSSLALSANGNIIAIGASLNRTGYLSVFEREGQLWRQRGSDIEANEVYEDWTDLSVSISGDGNVIAVGSPFSYPNGWASGNVRIFEWWGDEWYQMGIDIEGEIEGDYFGNEVSLSEDGYRLAVGVPFHSANGFQSGCVVMSEWDGELWTMRGSVIAGEDAENWFGTSVSLSANGNVVSAGATFNSGYKYKNGHTRVFEWKEGDWWQRGRDIDGENENDMSGYKTAISADGNVVVSTSIYNDGKNGEDSGHVRIFEWYDGDWYQRGDDIDGEFAYDYSGYEVAVAGMGNIVAVSSVDNDENGYDSGHVRFYQYEPIYNTNDTLAKASGPIYDTIDTLSNSSEPIYDTIDTLSNFSEPIYDTIDNLSNSSEPVNDTIVTALNSSRS